MKINFLAEAENLFEYSQKFRRDFHMYPELGFNETRTSGIIAEEINKLGLEVRTGVAKTGVTTTIVGRNPGKVCMLRFDMDALPIQEESVMSYISRNPGVMHACGHDAHIAIGITAAKLIARHQNDLNGTIKLIFQPAEEGLGGAQQMINEGVLTDPKSDYALGIHVWNEAPLGWLGISDGPVLAASEIFNVVVRGRGGHGALPNNSIDPILATSEIISALQSIVSRNIHPQKTAVVSVTAIQGGQAFNVIPQDVEFKGTIRTFESDVRAIVLEKFCQIVKGVATSLGCTAEINIQPLTPALVNDSFVASSARETARRLWPNISIDTDYRTMGSEDMAYYLQETPGCFILIGSANPQAGLNASHHHPKFDFDEGVLPKAASLIVAAAYDLLSS